MIGLLIMTKKDLEDYVDGGYIKYGTPLNFIIDAQTMKIETIVEGNDINGIKSVLSNLISD